MHYKLKLLAFGLSIVSPFAFADDIEKITVHGVQYHEDGTYTNVYLGNDVTIISNEMIHAAGGVDINKILSQFVPGLFANGLIAGDYLLANVGLQAWLTPMQEQQVSLTIDNLFDSEVTQSIFKHGHKAQYPIASLGAPRTLQLQYRYLF